jgi:crotonobetainyl-CoA:carnitine CoA-transferase CaiB-like acyl-CoA transferase
MLAAYLANPRYGGPVFTLRRSTDGAIADFFADPQVQHNQTVFEIEDSEYGPIRQLGFPVRFSQSRLDVQSRAPKLSEHRDEIRSMIGDRT